MSKFSTSRSVGTTSGAATHDPVMAAVLAGGLGTRLQPARLDVPKVLAQVNGRPFIAFVLDQLAAAGIVETVLLVGHRANEVKQALGDCYAGMCLSYAVETSPLGTAGALRQALPLLKTATLLLLNGDSYCEVKLPRLLAMHNRCQADMTLTLAHVDDASRFGSVRVTNDKVTDFAEKQDDAGPGWINAGITVLSRALVAEIPPERLCSLERELLPGWVKSRRVCGYKATGRFLDIGTPASYARAPIFFATVKKDECLSKYSSRSARGIPLAEREGY